MVFGDLKIGQCFKREDGFDYVRIDWWRAIRLYEHMETMFFPATLIRIDVWNERVVPVDDLNKLQPNQYYLNMEIPDA